MKPCRKKNRIQKVMTGVWIGAMSLILIGCGIAENEIRLKAQTERTDVFMEIKNVDAPPRGFAVLTMKATIKTPLPGYHLFELKESPHGTPRYPFLINIDGQSEIWKVDGHKESLPRIFSRKWR